MPGVCGLLGKDKELAALPSLPLATAGGGAWGAAWGRPLQRCRRVEMALWQTASKPL